MNKIPNELIVYLSNYLDSASYYCFRLSNDRISEVLDHKLWKLNDILDTDNIYFKDYPCFKYLSLGDTIKKNCPRISHYLISQGKYTKGELIEYIKRCLSKGNYIEEYISMFPLNEFYFYSLSFCSLEIIKKILKYYNISDPFPYDIKRFCFMNPYGREVIEYFVKEYSIKKETLITHELLKFTVISKSLDMVKFVIQDPIFKTLKYKVEMRYPFLYFKNNLKGMKYLYRHHLIKFRKDINYLLCFLKLPVLKYVLSRSHYNMNINKLIKYYLTITNITVPLYICIKTPIRAIELEYILDTYKNKIDPIKMDKYIFRFFEMEFHSYKPEYIEIILKRYTPMIIPMETLYSPLLERIIGSIRILYYSNDVFTNKYIKAIRYLCLEKGKDMFMKEDYDTIQNINKQIGVNIILRVDKK